MEENNELYLELDLPEILKKSLAQFKQGQLKIKNHEKYTQFDLDYDELCSVINVCEIEQTITKRQAFYLRNTYL